jgi:ribonuclease HII
VKAASASRATQLKPSGPASFAEEEALRRAGYGSIAGVDEAGRGAWAGPVTAAAVIFPAAPELVRELRGVADSKTLSAARREALRVTICAHASAWCVAHASNTEIDTLGILPATRLAMMRAVAGLHVAPDALLIDAVKLPALALHHKAFNFADAISLSVAAASILAKTARDTLMRGLAGEHARYRFGVHKGYGTALHRAALEAHGPSTLHRLSYKPVRALCVAATADQRADVVST